jgi:hypothetical protein
LPYGAEICDAAWIRRAETEQCHVLHMLRQIEWTGLKHENTVTFGWPISLKHVLSKHCAERTPSDDNDVERLVRGTRKRLFK